MHLKTHRIEYKIEINGKYVILRGDSGKGKTTLYDLADLYSRDNYSVQCPGHSKIITMNNVKDIYNTQEYKDYIILIDEDDSVLHKSNSVSILRSFDSWFLIINRSVKLDYLTVDLNNILRLTASGKFHTTEMFYPEVERDRNLGKFQLILCEDSKSGYLFLKDLFSLDPSMLEIIQYVKSDKDDSTGGRSKIVSALKNYLKEGIYRVCIVFDRVGIGFTYDAIYAFCKKHKHLKLYTLDWSSYEGYILASDVVGLPDIEKGLCIENVEKYLLDVLQEQFPGISYSKSELSACFKQKRCEHCKVHGCKYRCYRYEDFIYGKVAEIHDSNTNT